MAWIESHDNLKDHPKTRRAARLLGVSVPTIIGHLHLLWHWCLSYAEDGDLSGYDAEDIADAVMWDGDPNQFIDALLNCGPAGKTGFLERDDQGRLLVHDWYDYAGKLLEKREEAREAGARGNHERWHVQRGIVDPTCPYCQEASAQDGQAIGSPSGGESGGDSQPESEPNRVLSHRTLTVPNHTNKLNAAANARARVCEGEEDCTPDESPINAVSASPLAVPDLDEPVADDSITPEQFYEKTIGVIGPTVADAIEHYRSLGLHSSAIKWGIREFALSEGKTTKYLLQILERLSRQRLLTAEAAEAAKARDRPKPRNEPGYKTALEEARRRWEEKEAAST